MSTKHTPGPWYGLEGDWKSIVADAPYGDGLALVCRVAPLTYKGQDRHNKALILAAPDLLEACESYIAAHDIPDALDSALSFEDAERKIRAAIAKAKGEIKPTKPSIDWSHVAAGLNWLAVDDDDSACLFLCRPQINAQGFWEKTGHGISHSVNAEMFASFEPGTCDWRDSLIVRPGYEESGS